MRRVLAADDHPMCAAALEMAVHAVDQAIQVDVCRSLADVERALAAERYDLVLLDLVLPDVQGFAGLALVRARAPRTPVCVVSSRDEAAVVRQAHRGGARGFLSKASPISEMVSAVRVLLEGGQWFDAAATDDAREEGSDALDRLGSLSAAQLRVLRAIASGKQNKQIAYELNLSEPTIKSHLASVYRKIDVSNRTQAVLFYESMNMG